MRVFIGLQEIAGYYSRLIPAFEKAGIKTTYLSERPHPFAYKTRQASPWIQKWAHFSLATTGQSFFRNVAKLFLVLYLALTHKVFIFSSLSTFNLFRPYGELALLKLLRRRIIYVMHGSDTRPIFLERYGLMNRSGKVISSRALLQLSRKRIEKLRSIERYADFIVANPLSAQLHHKHCINWYKIGIPSPEVVNSRGMEERFNTGPPLILHSPSDPIAKGSNEIKNAVAALRAKGLEFEYMEISGRPHSEVLEALSKCAFVVDQLYSDQPMAGFATEAAAFGKASIVGSYGWRELRDNAGMKTEGYPPVIECEPNNVQEVIEKALLDPQWVRAIGDSAREFVEKYWSAEAVVDRFIVLFNQQAPSEWFFSPQGIRYYLGCTVQPSEIAFMVRSLLALDEDDCLGLNDKPELEAALIDMANTPLSPEMESASNRITALEKLVLDNEQKIAKQDGKLTNFRGMIDRRDKRIEKLEKKLKIKK